MNEPGKTTPTIVRIQDTLLKWAGRGYIELEIVSAITNDLWAVILEADNEDVQKMEHRLDILMALATQRRLLVDGSWMVRADDVDALARGLYDHVPDVNL